MVQVSSKPLRRKHQRARSSSLPFATTSHRFDPAPIVRRILESVPVKYASGLPRKRRRSTTKSRRRKVSVIEARGLYHPAFDGSRAWIEIFVDTTLRGWENGWWLRIPLLREGKIGDVLFHEIGHHIHFSSRPEYREREDVADVWKVRLQKQYTNKRFRWTAGLGRLIRPLLGSFMDR
jgi:hypothetical protein